MAQVNITAAPGVPVDAYPGDAPTDQSALVADLTAQLVAASSETQALRGALALANELTDTQAAHIADLQAQLAVGNNAQAKIDAYRTAHDALLTA